MLVSVWSGRNNIHFATILMIIYKVKNKDFYVPEKPIHIDFYKS